MNVSKSLEAGTGKDQDTRDEFLAFPGYEMVS